MRLAVLGSSSRGNAVALEASGRLLLVDAGFGPRALARRLRLAGFPPEPLAGIVLTHEHGDHSRGAVALARRTMAPLIGSAGTLDALRIPAVLDRVVVSSGVPLTVGPFVVEGCPVPHDAAEPMAYAVEADGERVGVALDVGRATGVLELLLRGATRLVVEANHDELMLRTGPYPSAVRQRIAGIGGHLSNRAAGELLASICHAGLQTVVLAHLSADCNTPALARAAVMGPLRRRGFRGELVVAGRERPITVTPRRAA